MGLYRRKRTKNNANFKKTDRKNQLERYPVFKEKREETKDIFFFKNGIFKKIYILKPYGDKYLKYDVVWITDLIEN